MPSGKQILLSILQELSQDNNSPLHEDSSDTIRAGLLLHGSSAKYMWPLVERLSWQHISEADLMEDGNPDKVIQQGIGIKQGLLSELFDALWEENQIPPSVTERFPDLTQEDFQAGMKAIKLLLTAVEWHRTPNEVEQNGTLDLTERDRLIGVYKRKLGEYREDPEDYS